MAMLIAFVVAMDRHRLIGADGKLPWRLPADLRWFKQVTLGKPIIMGRRTYESIGRALPGRDNIVLTRNRFYQAKGCQVVHSVEEAVAAAESADSAEVMVIGGSQIFRLFLPHANRLYLTTVDAALEGDTYFPELDPADWRETFFEDRPPDEANPFGLRFAVWERVSPARD
jgi:dihydrofolate reductase